MVEFRLLMLSNIYFRLLFIHNDSHYIYASACLLINCIIYSSWVRQINLKDIILDPMRKFAHCRFIAVSLVKCLFKKECKCYQFKVLKSFLIQFVLFWCVNVADTKDFLWQLKCQYWPLCWMVIDQTLMHTLSWTR